MLANLPRVSFHPDPVCCELTSGPSAELRQSCRAGHKYQLLAAGISLLHPKILLWDAFFPSIPQIFRQKHCPLERCFQGNRTFADRETEAQSSSVACSA